MKAGPKCFSILLRPRLVHFPLLNANFAFVYARNDLGAPFSSSGLAGTRFDTLPLEMSLAFSTNQLVYMRQPRARPINMFQHEYYQIINKIFIKILEFQGIDTL